MPRSYVSIENMSQHTEDSKDAALRAVGRTVVNFQRLEHYLKLAARLGPVRGTLSKIQRDVEKRVERTAALTLGQAIQAWISANEGEPSAASYTPDLFDVTMQVTFSLCGDAESRGAHAVALKALLETRNRLIHCDLVQFQWDSPEECAQLVKELDDVNEAIRSQIEFVASVLSALAAIRPEHFEITQAELSGELASVPQARGDG